MSHRIFCLLLVFTVLSEDAHAQDSSEIDSLRADLAARPADDTLRLYTLRYLWRATRSEPEVAKAYARQQIREATKLNHLVRRAEGYKFLAISIGDVGLSDSIRYYNKIAMELYQEIGDGFQIGVMSYNQAIIYQENGEFAQAERLLIQADSAFAGDSLFKQQAAVRTSMAKLDRLQARNEAAVVNATKAFELARLANDSFFMADAKQEIAFNYQDLNDWETATRYHRENADFFLRNNDPYFACVSLLNLASGYQSTDEYERAMQAGEEALSIAEENGYRTLEIDVLNVLGNHYWGLGNLDQAEQHFQRALPLFEGADYERVRAEVLVYLCGVQSKQKKWSTARRNGLAGVALAEEQGQLKLAHRAYGQLATVEKNSGNFEQAYDYMVLRQGYQDSLYQQQLGAKVAELTLAFERERQDRVIAEQQAELALAASQARADRLQRGGLIGGILALLALLAAGYYSYQQRLRKQAAEKNRLAVEVKTHQKELSAHALQMAQKGQLLDQLAAELESVRGERPDDRKKLDGLLRGLSSEERIDQDWDNFRNYFQGVHGDFEERLKAAAEAPLSPRELRLAALIKMQLNNQEVGAILGVSQDSLYKAKYRLRKKLPGAGEGELDGYVREL